MDKAFQTVDLGLMEYKQAWDTQELLHQGLIASKSTQLQIKTSAVNTLLLCEHPHVYTLGKSGEINNLLINEAFLKSIDATFFKSNRGGDITYHGPGQLVGYPIFDLESFGLHIREYIFKMEEVIIQTIKHWGLEGGRDKDATGVWLQAANGKPLRKVCAIGVKISRWVSMHGFALNVNTDLKYFGYINPCGFSDRGVTSIQAELNQPIEMEEIKAVVKENFVKLFPLKTS